jgi:predicted RNA-binding Zn-ribbon protein involved in translation (DUF1610 family)
LSCPNCGGKLDVSPTTLSLLCQNCGTEHLVRREAGNILLEGYARCPVCNRNDRVEKLTKFSKGLPKPINSIPSNGWFLVPFFVWIPFWGQVPLWVSPIRSKKMLLTFLVVLGFILWGVVYQIVSMIFDNEFIGGFFGAVIAIIFFAVFCSIYYKEINMVIADKKNTLSVQMKEWESAKGIWEKLYYCDRDDCIYDPSTKKNVSKEKLSELLGISYEPTVLINKG